MILVVLELLKSLDKKNVYHVITYVTSLHAIYMYIDIYNMQFIFNSYIAIIFYCSFRKWLR